MIISQTSKKEEVYVADRGARKVRLLVEGEYEARCDGRSSGDNPWLQGAADASSSKKGRKISAKKQSGPGAHE